MPSKRYAIVCNSLNPDLVLYFLRDISDNSTFSGKNSLIILKNRQISIISPSTTVISSFSKKAFIDPRMVIDVLVAPFICFYLIFKRVTVIHFTTAHFTNIIYALILKFFKTRLIFTIHDLIPHPGRKSIFISLYNQLIILLADRILTFSSLPSSLKYDSAKFVITPLSGFKIQQTSPKVGFNILFFGRIDQYKGIGNLLQLAKQAEQLNTNISFVIAGKGNLECLEDLKTLRNVTIINRFIDETEVPKLFSEAMFTILPYDSATQSGVALLSYSYATPVIAYDVGNLREYIEHGVNGYLFKHGDLSSILDLITNISEDELLTLSQNVINIFNEKYSDAARTRYTELLYKKEISPWLAERS